MGALAPCNQKSEVTELLQECWSAHMGSVVCEENYHQVVHKCTCRWKKLQTKFFWRVLSTLKFCLPFDFAFMQKSELQEEKNVDYWFFDPFFQQQLALNSGDVLTASETSALNTSRTNNPAFSVWRS